ncbi:MAG: hypothetical protein Q9219_004882 [cf. Caloplaca sp. 3 TL-2023]
MKSMANGQAVAPRIIRKPQPTPNHAQSNPEDLDPSSSASKTTNGSANDVTQAPVNGDSCVHPPAENGVTALLEGQRKDIDRIITNVDNLLQEMKTVKASMEYLKFQQTTFAAYADQEVAKPPAALAEELQGLTKRVSELDVTADKIDRLTEDVNALSEHVHQNRGSDNQVEILKSKLKYLTWRIERLEEQSVDGRAPYQAARSGGSLPPDSRRMSEPVFNKAGTLREVPSSTRCPSEYTSIALRKSASTLSFGRGELEQVPNSDVERSRSRSRSRARNATPPSNLVDILRPHITSAEKVAARKRHRSQSSVSSSSSVITPPPKRTPGRPRIHPEPDYTTKTRSDLSVKRKLTSLNDYQHVVTSDPEDSDYAPRRFLRQAYDIPSAKNIDGARTKPPIRLPTPEWEKPDWENPYPELAGTRNRNGSTARRGVSGRATIPDRESFRRRSAGHHHHAKTDYVSAYSPEYWDDGGGSSSRHRESSVFATSQEKPRDSEGNLLLPNGKVDGRSLRHRRARAARSLLLAKEPPAKRLVGLQDEEENRPAGRRESGRFVDAAALAAAGYGLGPPQPSLLPLPVVGSSGGPNQKSPTEQMSMQSGVKQEVDSRGTSAPASALPAPAPAVATTAAAAAAAAQGGNEAHRKIMGQVFPWR